MAATPRTAAKEPTNLEAPEFSVGAEGVGYGTYGVEELPAGGYGVPVPVGTG